MSSAINNNQNQNQKNHNKYRKDKPWDVEGIDHWKIDEWKPEDANASGGSNSSLFLEESS